MPECLMINMDDVRKAQLIAKLEQNKRDFERVNYHTEMLLAIMAENREGEYDKEAASFALGSILGLSEGRG